MHFTPTDVEIQREHYSDLLREAEHERLVQLVLESRPNREPVVQRFIHWIERAARRWACRLAPANTRMVCSPY